VPETRVLKPDIDFIRTVKDAGGDTLKQCYQCATCSIVCNLAPQEHPFPRKQMIYAQWGLKEELLSDASIWLCHQCNDCSTNCPREARPGDVFAALRSYAFQHFAFPSFMGKALANPKSLPFLFLVPVLVLLGILFGATGGDLGFLFSFTGEVDYAHPWPHGALEMLFIGGNVLIFAFAAMGLLRFWKGLQQQNPGKEKTGFIPVLIKTVIEIGTHSKFSQCEANKPRYLGHLLLFYGTLGAAITAGLALFFTVILQMIGSPFYLHSPIDFPNPIKILGVASGIAMLIGGSILISRRRSGDDEVGQSRYSDWLFIWVIFLVGVTGLLSWILRLIGIPIIAYLDYYIHLVLVFFLLWYAPYSKFGHMFYRTLALIHTKSAGADVPRKKAA
jgi:quinone-modifying oxidoreductase subunit QmoC